MAKIPNFYNPITPLGKSLGNLAGVLASGGSEADRIKAAEEALALKNKREGITSLADLYRNFGTENFDLGGAMGSAIMGGYKPQELGDMHRFGSANTYGATDQRTSDAFVGAGGAYSSTAHGFREGEANENTRHANTLAESARAADAKLAEDARQFDMTPYAAVPAKGGMPTIMTRSSAVGQAPIMSETEQKGFQLGASWGDLANLPQEEQRVLGAAPKEVSHTPRNYRTPDGRVRITYDGVTDAATGAPLPQGGYIAGVEGSAQDTGLTTSVEGNLQGQDISNQKFRNLLAQTRSLAEADPTNFGVTGRLKGVAQDATALAQNISLGLGYPEVGDAVAEVRRKAIESGVNPGVLSGVFDPKLPALQTAADLLAFSAAEALAGQQGRSVSDRDVVMFKNIVGDPSAWLSSQEQFLAKLTMIEQILGGQQQVIDSALGKDQSRVPEAPVAPGAAQPSQRWTRDANGQLVRVQ